MYISRRSSDLFQPSDYEHQTFACRSCDTLVTRRIGKSASAMALAAK